MKSMLLKLSTVHCYTPPEVNEYDSSSANSTQFMCNVKTLPAYKVEGSLLSRVSQLIVTKLQICKATVLCIYVENPFHVLVQGNWWRTRLHEAWGLPVGKSGLKIWLVILTVISLAVRAPFLFFFLTLISSYQTASPLPMLPLVCFVMPSIAINSLLLPLTHTVKRWGSLSILI